MLQVLNTGIRRANSAFGEIQKILGPCISPATAEHVVELLVVG
jgi:hypothetical protein